MPCVRLYSAAAAPLMRLPPPSRSPPSSGHGVFRQGSALVASTAALLERNGKLLTALPRRARCVRSATPTPFLALFTLIIRGNRYPGRVGDVVVGRVAEISADRWKVDIGSRQVRPWASRAAIAPAAAFKKAFSAHPAPARSWAISASPRSFSRAESSAGAQRRTSCRCAPSFLSTIWCRYAARDAPPPGGLVTPRPPPSPPGRGPEGGGRWHGVPAHPQPPLRQGEPRRPPCGAPRVTGAARQLVNGQLEVVPADLVPRLQQHMVSLPCGVDAILGCNGFIWLTGAPPPAASSPGAGCALTTCRRQRRGLRRPQRRGAPPCATGRLPRSSSAASRLTPPARSRPRSATASHSLPPRSTRCGAQRCRRVALLQPGHRGTSGRLRPCLTPRNPTRSWDALITPISIMAVVRAAQRRGLTARVRVQRRRCCLGGLVGNALH